MNFHYRFLIGVMWVLAFLCPSITQAGTLLLDMGDGTQQTFNGVVVESVQSDPSRGLIFMISPGPGQAAFEVEANRVANLAFGNNGGDAYYDVVIKGQNGQNLSFPGSNIISYSNGNFLAIAPGRTVQEALPANQIVSMIPGFAPVATPPPLAPPPSNNTNFDNPFPPSTGAPVGESLDAFDQNDFQSDESSLSDDEYYYDEDSFASDDEYYYSEGEFGAADAGLAVVILVGLVLVSLSWLITTIWLIVDAVRQGELLWIVGILCCTIGKLWYVSSKYDGPFKLVIQIVVVIETVILIAARFTS